MLSHSIFQDDLLEVLGPGRISPIVPHNVATYWRDSANPNIKILKILNPGLSQAQLLLLPTLLINPN
jgi:hypothetical protein